MPSILILGAGRIGRALGHLLKASGDYAVTVADRDAAVLAPAAADGLATLELDATSPGALRRAMAGTAAAVSACPFHLNAGIAEVARDLRVDYVDLTEDVATTGRIRALAANAPSLFAPQCGLAPGAIAIVGQHLADRFERLREVKLRVGALPRFASNAIAYNLTWSTEGLVNEYCNPCEAIVDGARTQVPPLEGLESFTLDGRSFEAFNTSGGVGSLCESLEGRVEQLSYKSVRYPGHCQAMRLLLVELGLGRNRPLMKEILEQAVPTTAQDLVVLFVTATGWRDGRLEQESFVRFIEGRVVAGRSFSAIELTTAAAAAAVLDLRFAGAVPAAGFLRQEQVPLEAFLANRFGRVYS